MSSISAYAMLYIFLMPASLVGILDDDSLKLYTLIWSQSMACQMKAASIKTVNLFFSANAIIQYPCTSMFTCVGCLLILFCEKK